MKSKSHLLSVLCSSAIAFAAPLLHGVTVLYSTNFNAPTYSDGGLIGQDDWLITGTSVVNPINVANTAVNGTVTLTTTGQDVRHLFSPAVTADSVYLQADITVGSAQTTGDYFLHLGDGGTSNFYARTYIKSSPGGFVMAMATSSGTPVYGSSVLALNTTYTILVRYDIVTGTANDTGALFINPTSPTGTGDTPYVTATTVGTDATTISSVNLRQGGSTSGPGVTVDNISVSVVPEPGVALLGTIGLFGLLLRRRPL